MADDSQRENQQTRLDLNKPPVQLKTAAQEGVDETAPAAAAAAKEPEVAPASADGKDITLYLVAADAGDGGDFEQFQLVFFAIALELGQLFFIGYIDF
jgi:hypothetical protein